jgi:hypothetical protein
MIAPPSQLSVVRLPKEDGMTMSQIAETTFPHRARSDGCHWDTSGITFIPAVQQDFREVEIGGHAALTRSECSYFDAVIDTGDGVLIVVLRSVNRASAGDQSTFDQLMETLEITAPAESPDEAAQETWTLFRSELHGYSIRYPPDWHATHSTEEGRPDVLDESLRDGSFGSRLLIRRRALPPGSTPWDLVRDWFPQARRMAGGCGTPSTFGSMPRMAFKEAMIAGWPAIIRSDCGFVDALVSLDGDALTLVLESKRSRPTGDNRLFAKLTESLNIEDSP